MKKKSTQTTMILAHLKKGSSITPMDALKLFGCFRLSARIADIRSMGYKVVTKYVTEKGKTYASYRMLGDAR